MTAKIGLFVSGGGNFRLNGANTYSAGSIVDTNTTLSVGQTATLGTNTITLSNNAICRAECRQHCGKMH